MLASATPISSASMASMAGATRRRRWPTRSPSSGREGERPLVVITGGEPMLQLDGALIAALHGRGFEIAVETNGTLPAPPGIDWICVSPKAGTEVVQRSGDELKLVWPQDGHRSRRFARLGFPPFPDPADGLRRAPKPRAPPRSPWSWPTRAGGSACKPTNCSACPETRPPDLIPNRAVTPDLIRGPPSERGPEKGGCRIKSGMTGPAFPPTRHPGLNPGSIFFGRGPVESGCRIKSGMTGRASSNAPNPSPRT